MLGCRQKARISKIEEELGRLQQEMRQMRLDNQRLKSKVRGLCVVDMRCGCRERALPAGAAGQPATAEELKVRVCGCL